MKVLDIVKTNGGGIGIVTEVSDKGKKASIEFINGLKANEYKSAWWTEEELTVVDTFNKLLGRAMKHPFSV